MSAAGNLPGAAMGLSGSAPVAVDAQEQLQAAPLRVVHLLHDAGHAAHDPREARWLVPGPGLDRGHFGCSSRSPAGSPAGDLRIAVRPPPPDRTNALIPAPVPVLGRVTMA